MYKMVSVFLISSFFTVYGNGVLKSEKNIKLTKAPKAEVAKLKHEKPQIYGGERTSPRELNSIVKANNKVTKNILAYQKRRRAKLKAEIEANIV